MKNKILISIVIVTVLSLETINAQVIPSIRKASLTENDQTILDQHISKYATFTIDKKDLIDNLYGNGGTGQFRLRIDEQLDWTIDLEFNDMRAPDFRQEYVSYEGTFEYKEFSLNTFKGRTSNNQIARFTIDEDNFFGVIINDMEHYIIRPTKDYTKNSADESFIVYKNLDIIITEDDFDYLNDALETQENIENGFINRDEFGNTELGGGFPSRANCLKLRLAIDADYTIYQAFGSNLPNTYSYMLSLINIVDGIYEETFGLNIMITYQNIWTSTSSPNYPYGSSYGGYNDLFAQFAVYWRAISQATVTRNNVHLFHNKTGWGSAGHIGQIDDPSIMFNPASGAYSMSSYDPLQYFITTHEISHNMGANHPPIGLSNCDNSIMGGLNTTQPITLYFCNYSINEISTCLNANSYKLYTNLCSGTMAIWGPEVVCNGGSYFGLANPPSGTIYWTVSNTTNFAVNPTGNPTAVSRRGSGTGSATLSARTGSASGPVVAQKTISLCSSSQPSVSGSPALICSGASATFYASNWQPGCTWAVSSNLTITSSSSSSITVTRNGSNNGIGKVSIKSLTGIELASYSDIWVGKPSISLYAPYDIVPQMGYEATLDYDNATYTQQGVTSYNWTCTSNLKLMTKHINKSGFSVNKMSGVGTETARITVQVTNACSSTSTYQDMTIYWPSPSHSYPNPVNDILTIETGTSVKVVSLTYDIRLYDGQGNLLRQAVNKGGTVQFNVSALPDGIYYLHIYDGINSTPEMQQIVVQH